MFIYITKQEKDILREELNAIHDKLIEVNKDKHMYAV